MAMAHDEFITTMNHIDAVAQHLRSQGVPEAIAHMGSIVRTWKENVDLAARHGTIDQAEHDTLTAKVMQWMDPLPPKSVWRKIHDAVLYGHI